jgi:hypothetical protein
MAATVHCQLNLFESVRNSFPQIVETGKNSSEDNNNRHGTSD